MSERENEWLENGEEKVPKERRRKKESIVAGVDFLIEISLFCRLMHSLSLDF